MHHPRLKSASLRALAGTLAIASAAVGLAGDLKISVRPVFEGIEPNGSNVTPLIVDISNDGGSKRGELEVGGLGANTYYSVDLRANDVSSVTVYPTQDYSGAAFNLRAGGQYASEFYNNYRGNGYGQFGIGMISNTRGDLAFTKNVNWGFNETPADGYAIPKEAPDRPLGYERLRLLFLGTGSQGIPDKSAEAIKSWVLTGGTLVFTGSAIDAMKDPRWANIVPAATVHERRFADSRYLRTKYGYATGSFNGWIGDPVESARSIDPDGLMIERSFGLGRVVFLGFDPFSTPFTNWPVRGKLFTDTFSPALLLSSQMVLGTVDNVAAANPNNDINTNPFAAELPQASSVGWLLGLYFLAVVPANFLILRKMKRGELAWATAPVLSLGFAGVFFGAARGLYSAQLSTRSASLLIAQEGQRDGVVVGHSQIYFPREGQYDLGLTNVDSVLMGSSEQNYNPGQVGLTKQDEGSVTAKLAVPNLAFREIRYRQIAPAGEWFQINRVGTGKFEIKNSSPYVLKSPAFCGPGVTFPLKDLAPGETTTISMYNAQTGGDETTQRLDRSLMRMDGYGLAGVLEGYRPGTQVGTEVGEAGTRLLFVANERGQQDFAQAAQAGKAQ